MTHDVRIGASWMAGEGAAFQKTCPAYGDVVWSGRAASPAQVRLAVDAARHAFEDWRRESNETRAEIMRRYADGLRSRKQDLATAISRDMGKPLWESLTEADAMAAKIEVSIDAQNERAGGWNKDTAFGAMALAHRPHGVMAVFGPFNFPGHLPNGHIVPALLAGNACVFKPSEQAPSVASIMVDALSEAGLPDGVLTIVQGGRETGAALLDAQIDGVLFTGSSQTGLHIHRHFAGRPDVILALEMGGNNPLIVWDPCGVDAAAEIAFQSGFVTSGQRCSCARRLILPMGAFGDAVIEALAAKIDAAKIGAWDEDDIVMGPLVSNAAGDAAIRFGAALVDKGAKTVRPLNALDRGQAFVRPGLLEVTEIADAPDEELFGPLLQVRRAASFEEAVAAANETRYGLAAGVVCDDDDLWAQAHLDLRAGIVNRNRPTAGASSAQPFGGPGLSGNFRPGAYYASDYCAWPQASQVAPKA